MEQNDRARFETVVRDALENHNKEIEELFRYQNDLAKVVHENEDQSVTRDIAQAVLLVLVALMILAVVWRIA